MKHHNTWILALLLVALAPAASAQEVAIVFPLDAEARSSKLDTDAVRFLKPTDLIVLHDESLDLAIQQRHAPIPSTQTIESVVAATLQIGKGVERFFYMTPDLAVPLLQPTLDTSWHNPEVISFRTDLAVQVWHAGLVLIRSADEASGDKGDKTQVANFANQLVTMLPSGKVDVKSTPPKLLAFLDDAREKLAEANTTLVLQVAEPTCTVYLNGLAAPPDQEINVDPKANYYVQSQCPDLDKYPPVWRVDLVAQERNVMLVPGTQPHGDRTPNVHPARERLAAAWYLRAAAELAGADIALGVGLSAPHGEQIVLARYDHATQAVTWNDAEFSESLRRGMPTIFPEYTEIFAQVKDPVVLTDPPRYNWTGVAFTGVGALSAAIGTYLVVSSKRTGHRLDCALNNATPPPDVDCSDVPRGTTFEDFNRSQRAVGAAQTTGWMLLGIGAISAGFGVYRIIRPPPKREQAVQLEFNGTAMVLTW